MQRDEIERTLNAMGVRPVAALDDDAVERIELRWRSASLDPTTVVPLAARRRRALVIAGAGLAACAAAAAIGLVLSRDAPDQVVVADAEDIVIVLPDGQYVDPEPGETLPEGSFVQAGPYAAGRIGDNEVKPDDLFVVRHGHLKQAYVEELTAATPESSLAETVPPVAPPTTRRVSGAVVTTAATTSATTAEATSTSTTTTTTSTTLATTVVTAAETTIAGTVGATIVSNRPQVIKVNATLDGATVKLDWKDYSGEDFAQYVVLRVKHWDGTSRPKGGKLASIAERTASSFVDTKPKAGASYVVVVLGSDGKTLALGGTRSPYQAEPSVTAPPDTAPEVTGLAPDGESVADPAATA